MTSTVVSSLQQMLSEMDAALAVEIKVQENGDKSGGHIAIDGKPLEVQNVPAKK